MINLVAFTFGKRAGLTQMALTALTAGAYITSVYSSFAIADHLFPEGSRAWFAELLSQLNTINVVPPPASEADQQLSLRFKASITYLLVMYAIAAPVAFATVFAMIDSIKRPSWYPHSHQRAVRQR